MVKIYAHIARVLLGLIFVVSVVVRVLMPQIVENSGFPPAALTWLYVIRDTGYLQPLLYLTEFIGGGALLLNIFVPVALIILAPISSNIALFHFFLDPRLERIVLVATHLSESAIADGSHRESGTRMGRIQSQFF
jgi:putative oxidoreductase